MNDDLVFYRIVLFDPPTDEDFKSYFEQGREPSEDPEWNRLASGYSVYSDLGYARTKAKRYPWKSKCFIAELLIPADNPFRIEQTGPKGTHYTLWGEGKRLRSMVVRVVPARRGVGNV